MVLNKKNLFNKAIKKKAENKFIFKFFELNYLNNYF